MGVLVFISGMVCGGACLLAVSVLGKKFQQRGNRNARWK